MPSHRPCGYRGCKRICEVRGANRCNEHNKSGWSERASQPMPQGWTKLRNDYLALHFICEAKQQSGKPCTGRATTVDHILARAFGGTNDLGNLQALCKSHAAIKDRQDSAEGGRRARSRTERATG